MNELIISIFNNFTVDGVKIPVKYLYYEGHEETYITFMQQDADSSLSGDDDLIGYVDYYDFDIYSKDNYSKVIDELKKILKQNGFVWQVSRSSMDMYETDTGYYHKTLNFAIYRQED
jgi:hypothetical protein